MVQGFCVEKGIEIKKTLVYFTSKKNESRSRFDQWLVAFPERYFDQEKQKTKRSN